MPTTPPWPDPALVNDPYPWTAPSPELAAAVARTIELLEKALELLEPHLDEDCMQLERDTVIDVQGAYDTLHMTIERLTPSWPEIDTEGLVS